MGGSDFWMQMLETFIYLAPHFILYIGGIIFAMTRMKRAKTSATLVIICLGVLFLNTLLFSIVQTLVVMQINQSGGANSS